MDLKYNTLVNSSLPLPIDEDSVVHMPESSSEPLRARSRSRSSDTLEKRSREAFEQNRPSVQVIYVDNGNTVSVVVKSKTRSKRQLPTSITRCLTSSIPRTKQFKRSCIVPYFDMDDTRYYLMCIDAKYKQITPTGGSIEPDEDFVTAGTRELWEESMKLFDFRDKDAMEHVYNNSVAIYNENTIIMFQPVKVESPLALCQEFRQRYWKERREGADPHLIENSHMLWISEADLRTITYEGNSPTVKLPTDLAILLRPVNAYPSSPKPNVDLYPCLYIKARAMFALAYAVSTTMW